MMKYQIKFFKRKYHPFGNFMRFHAINFEITKLLIITDINLTIKFETKLNVSCYLLILRIY